NVRWRGRRPITWATKRIFLVILGLNRTKVTQPESAGPWCRRSEGSDGAILHRVSKTSTRRTRRPNTEEDTEQKAIGALRARVRSNTARSAAPSFSVASVLKPY